jgi:hypothetical protein
MMTLPWDKSLGRNDLPHVRFDRASTEAVISPPNILAQEASHAPKDATAYCSDKIRQRLVEDHVPSYGSYEP